MAIQNPRSVAKAAKTKIRYGLKKRRAARLSAPTDIGNKASRDVSGEFYAMQADVFALHVKTKNFQWHMSAPHFRDYHLWLDEQAD